MIHLKAAARDRELPQTGFNAVYREHSITPPSQCSSLPGAFVVAENDTFRYWIKYILSAMDLRVIDCASAAGLEGMQSSLVQDALLVATADPASVEVINQLLKINPNLKIIILSGHDLDSPEDWWRQIDAECSLVATSFNTQSFISLVQRLLAVESNSH